MARRRSPFSLASWSNTGSLRGIKLYASAPFFLLEALTHNLPQAHLATTTQDWIGRIDCCPILQHRRISAHFPRRLQVQVRKHQQDKISALKAGLQ
jgi:hypothetical protein